jgi:hypothetical protein
MFKNIYYTEYMNISPIRFDHPEIELLLPTQHCFLRFRERAKNIAPGFEALQEKLQIVVQEAQVTTNNPTGSGKNPEWSLWLVNNSLAFPLIHQSKKIYLMPTCLEIKKN